MQTQSSDPAQESGVLTRTERIVANTGELSSSTGVESGDKLGHEVLELASAASRDFHEFGPLQGRSGPLARWEGFEPPAA
jgi:hypothetical protein